MTACSPGIRKIFGEARRAGYDAHQRKSDTCLRGFGQNHDLTKKQGAPENMPNTPKDSRRDGEPSHARECELTPGI